MLVLSRKTGEQIHVGDDIVISVVQTGSGRVRLGIEAPPRVPVDRAEIYQRRRRDIEEWNFRARP